MRAALEQARLGFGLTSPNPAVGAVLVRAGKIIAFGFHARAGSAHAEVACLGQLRGSPRPGDILYVTLEPCSTPGRTGACTEMLVDSGIGQVVIGATDPNPRHAGRGFDSLRAAGVEVINGILEAECTALNPGYNKWIQTGQPFVIAKCGMSLDGRLTPPGQDRWITSAAARRDAHRLRASVDAVLIGAETLRKDDPQLTVRGIRDARQPLRVVLTRSNRLPREARLFADRHADKTLVLRGTSLTNALRDLGKRELTSVLIEGGGDVLSQALDQQLIDKVQIYLGPCFTGGPTLAFGGRGAARSSDAATIANIEYRRIGNDVCVTGDVRYASLISRRG